MPIARRSRTVAMPLAELWELISDPYHLPRWWPRVERVEGVIDDAFTEVMRTRKGKVVRADFDILTRDEHQHILRWAQRTIGTPFERVLKSAETEIALAPAAGGGDATTAVTIELNQEMAPQRGTNLLFVFAPRIGSPMVRRAANATIDEALDGLERISG